MKSKSKPPRKAAQYLSTRALARETGLDRTTIVKRLGWGCGEAHCDRKGRPTLRAFIHDLDEDDQRKVAAFRIGLLLKAQ